MEKATQFVHGTPRLAASHRTYDVVSMIAFRILVRIEDGIAPFARDMSGRMLAGSTPNRTKPKLTSHARDARCLEVRSAMSSSRILRDNTPPKAGMTGTVGVLGIAGSVARALAGRAYICGRRPLVIHGW